MQPSIVSVSDLVTNVRQLIERTFPLIWISGEISNFTRAASGHCYFSLKDNKAQVRCVMFRQKIQYLDWQPTNGMQVEVQAIVTMYEAKGEFQLSIESMRQAGLGALYEAFARLKIKLEALGLFDPARKKTLPTYPKTIGIITSPAAAALRDVLITLRRRMPTIPIIIYPTLVQGIGAAEAIAKAITTAHQRAECDVLILCRGGGSIEDLWAFNEEVVAHALFKCSIPIVSGVGHETDFTICDFVADMRAPTPTAAAEFASPFRRELFDNLMRLSNRLSYTISRNLSGRIQHTDYLSRRLIHPGMRIKQQSQQLNELWRRLTRAMTAQLDKSNFLVSNVQKHLRHLNPHNVLERGYSIVQNQEGEVIYSAKAIHKGDLLDITFAEGKVKTEVKET